MTDSNPAFRTIQPFSAEDRERFHTFLKLAAESTFPGERANALDAARRLAGRHGMSLEEAARLPEGDAEPMQPPPERARQYSAREMADLKAYSEARHRSDKERYERALKEAIARGLDVGAAKATASAAESARIYTVRRSGGRKRDPNSFAHILLSETSLPLDEIVSLTGLDIYSVVGMKLRLRSSV